MWTPHPVTTQKAALTGSMFISRDKAAPHMLRQNTNLP